MIRPVLAGALALGGLVHAGAAVSGWLTFGNDSPRSSGTEANVVLPVVVQWSKRLPGRITSQPLVVRGVPRAKQVSVFVATSAGAVYSLSSTGGVQWHVQLGRLTHQCRQLDGYGITGTPVIDRETETLYSVDALGQLHALALGTGKERAGWPVQLFSDFRAELVWGALAAVRGSIYVATGSYCDAPPMVGKVIRVDERTRRVSRWISVPPEEGGGGGIWGWGGIAYSASRHSLLAVTGNAFRGGSNDGDQFREWAAYGEHLVELTLDLRLRAASHPAGVNKPQDLDFVGSPVVVGRPGCSELVVAANKNNRIYAWKTAGIAAGPIWSLQLARADPSKSLLTQPAYSKRLHALFVVTRRGLVRIDVTRKCKGRIAWTRPLGKINGTPTIVGDRVWVAAWHGKATLIGIDARTGVVRLRRALGKDWYLVGPAVVDGRIYIGSFGGLVLALG